ncbi:NAD(P)H-binding protein [Lysinibacillus sp. D4A3_S15]|uniref:NAD(P)H-binding protein n=1 Tax=Lysinibacillus sp. D4A3_S15 TaxID=2941227 RepID=UPI0024BE9AFC|nr:NAD(P)H-binding protein [Lysinibacillus sp. D4A3_S15]
MGATGRVGRQIVEFALKDQHEVTTFVRDPHKLQLDNKNLHMFQGSVLNKKDLE